MTLDEWSKYYKHTLRDLYGDFIGDTYANQQEFDDDPDAVTYGEFQECLYRQTKWGLVA